MTKPADQTTDDLDLVAAVRAGDDRAFELLFLRYQSRITSYVRGMVRDHERAEDITQEVFIAALRRMRETDAPLHFKPWIYEIAKNACIDAFRRSRHSNEVSLQADDGLGPSIVAGGAGPDAAMDAKLAIDNLCGAFGGLSQAHRDILVMRELEGRTYQQIGERMGMSRAGVESTLFRARRRLGEEYEELVSGERCIRVRAIVDAPDDRPIGVRDQRRMARHVAHCQPCRRYARLAGVELEGVRTRTMPARIAAVLPLPMFLRRRFDVGDAGQLLGQHTAPAVNWSTKAVAVLDPGVVAGWPRAIATAATVAVAGLGAGAAVGERDTLKSLIKVPSSVVVVTPKRDASDERRAKQRGAPTAPQDKPAAASQHPTAVDSDHAPTGDVRVTPDAPRTGVEDDASPSTPASPDASAPTPSASKIVDDATKDIGAALPKADAPTVDAAVGEPRRPRPRRRPVKALVEGAAEGLDVDAGAGNPRPLRDVVSGVGNAIASGGAESTAVADAPTATAPTNGPIATAIGDVVGGVTGGR